MQRFKNVSGIVVFLTLLAVPAAAFACGAGDEGYTRAAKDLEPLTVIRDGEKQSLSLIGAYDFLEHPCLTGTVGFLAAVYGLAVLFGDETPVIEDVMVFSPSSGGSMGALDFIFKGDSPGNKTWPPVGANKNKRGMSRVSRFWKSWSWWPSWALSRPWSPLGLQGLWAIQCRPWAIPAKTGAHS